MNIEQKYQRDFSILKENGQLIGNWSNVYDHCKLEGNIAELLAKELQLSEQDTYDLVSAAILHDWFKKTERTTENYDTAYSEIGLQELGIDQRVIDIAHSVGHSTLIDCKHYDLLRKLMHLIDDIVSGTDITEIVERVNKVQARGHLVKLEDEMRPILSGKSFFDVQKEVGLQIQNEVEDLLYIDHGTLVTFIKQKIMEIE